MKKWIIIILSVVIVLVSGVCLYNLNKNPQPEDVIQKFEIAYNTSNIDMMIECCEPSVQKIYKGMMEVGSELFGVDLGTIISGMGGFNDIFGAEYGYGTANITITVNSKEVISDVKVKFNVTMQYIYRNANIPDNAPDKADTVIYVVKIDDEWYISAKNY